MPWFLGSQIAGNLTLGLQSLDVRCDTKTKDDMFVNVVASMQYRALADRANDALYKLSNTRTQIRAYVFYVIQASVPKLNLDDVFERKNEIARAVEEELEKAMSAGFEIIQTLFIDIESDEHLKTAMNEINAAARIRLASKEKAEAEKIVHIKRAEGEAESKYLAGLGTTDVSAFRDCFSLAWENPYVLRLAFSAGIGGLLFGYDTEMTSSPWIGKLYYRLAYLNEENGASITQITREVYLNKGCMLRWTGSSRRKKMLEAFGS